MAAQRVRPRRPRHRRHALRSTRGKDYVSTFGIRQRGTGPYAEQIGLRFRLAVKRLGLNERHLKLRTDLFRRPVAKGGQMSLLSGARCSSDTRKLQTLSKALIGQENPTIVCVAQETTATGTPNRSAPSRLMGVRSGSPVQ